MSAKPKPFQFRLRTLFIATVVVAVLLGIGRVVAGANLFGYVLVFVALGVIFVVPIAGVVVIARKSGLEFDGWEKGILVTCTGIHSVCMMMLATVAFPPGWKGDKGQDWIYYVLDAPAGYTLWPVYWIGVLSFIAAILNPNYAIRSRLNLVMIVTLAGISAWYSIAALFFKFCPPLLAFVPGIVCLEYSLYARLIVRHGKFEGIGTTAFFTLLSTWVTVVLAAIAAKIPLAMDFYEQLPNQAPNCFIVTAASRGHWWLVRTWRDDSGCTVNRQLMTFWQFEATLAAKAPRSHRVLRAVYNEFAPTVARCIIFPWMADIVYLLLKPVEWMAVTLNRLWAPRLNRIAERMSLHKLSPTIRNTRRDSTP